MTPASQPQEPPILNITGEQVALGPLRRDLLLLYHQWKNDFELQSLRGGPLRPATLEAVEAGHDWVIKVEADTWFTIYERSTLRPIGTTGLRHIDDFHRTAELGIGIGEKECRGRGYGTEVVALMLDYGFTALGLHNIMLQVTCSSERAIRAYTRVGFRVVGRRRESYRLGGQVFDEIVMDCLATDFQSPVLRRLLVPAAEGEGSGS